MAEFQALLDFPPAPKLTVLGKLDPAKATEAEKRGQELFFGKAQCATCHVPPYYTDNLMHNLRTERFYKPRLSNGRMASADGPIKTFPLRGIKDRPYLHDGRPDPGGHRGVLHGDPGAQTQRPRAAGCCGLLRAL